MVSILIDYNNIYNAKKPIRRSNNVFCIAYFDNLVYELLNVIDTTNLINLEVFKRKEMDLGSTTLKQHKRILVVEY